MKTSIIYLAVALIAVLAGIGGGHLYHQYKVATTKEEFYSNQWTVSDASSLSSRAFVRTPFFDFGEIDSDKQYRHEFVVENQGTRELEIWLEDGDLAPFKADISSEKIRIERGTTLPLAVSFDGKEITEDFEKQLEFKTNQNDGKSLILTIAGRIEGK